MSTKKSELDKINHPKYLGNPMVVKRMLAEMANCVTNQNIGAEVHRIAQVLLGQDSSYETMSWNAPGQIDEWLVQHNWVSAADSPEDRIAKVLLDCIEELVDAGKAERGTPPMPIINSILDKYTRFLIGLPPPITVPRVAEPEDQVD